MVASHINLWGQVPKPLITSDLPRFAVYTNDERHHIFYSMYKNLWGLLKAVSDRFLRQA